jgi:DUF4097 and DUF4098 domain-containing protein YvlB
MKTIALRWCRAGLPGGLWLAAGTILAAADFENNLEKTFQVAPGGKLIVEADQGSCELTSVEGDKVQVRVLRESKSATRAQANELFANHEVTFQQDGGTVSVVAKSKKDLTSFLRANRPYLQVRYLISLPAKLDVDLKTSGGDIVVGNRDGSVQARTSSGAIRLQHASGSIEVNDSGGNITIGEAGGDLIAQTSSGSISVQKVSGKAEISNSGGDIQIDDAARAVVAKTSSGSIRLKSVKGDVEASNSGGDIQADLVGGNLVASTSSGSINLGQLKGQRVNLKNSGGDIGIESADGSVAARTSSGAIKIKAAKGPVDARNSGGDIGIGDAGDSVKAETSSGSIRIQAARGVVEARNAGGDITIGNAVNQVAARTSSGSITVESVKGNLKAANSGGNIEVKAAWAAVQATTSSGAIVADLVAQPTEDCRLEVSGGNITLTIPKSAGFKVDARSSGGKIETELPVAMTVRGEPKSGVLQGKINEGGPALFLRSSSGDIQIKASNAPVPQIQVEEDKK